MKKNSENQYYDYDNPPPFWVTFLVIVTSLLFGFVINYLCINL